MRGRFRPILSLPALAHRLVYGLRPSPRTANSQLPSAIDAVFFRGLAKLPEERFRNSTEFASALRSALDTPRPPTVEIPDDQPSTVIKPARRSALHSLSAFVVTAAIFVPLIAGLFVYNISQAKDKPAPTPQPAAVIQHTQPPPPDAASASGPTTPQAPAASGPLVVKQFRSDPPSIKAGTPAMLIWDVAGADSVLIDHGVGKVSAKGMFAVVPASSTTYSLTASDSQGKTHRTLSVDVEPDNDFVLPSVKAKQLLEDGRAKRQQGNLEEAASLFNQAAALGDTSAMVEVGEAYSSGYGVPQDESKAISFFRRTADAGNTSAMVALGGMYLLGANGKDADYEEAARWFQKGADRENPAALFDLGSLYESGRGVPKNLDKARELYQKAARLGNVDAQKRLHQWQNHR